MFKSKFSKLCAVLLVFAIFFSVCPVSYAYTRLPKRWEPNSIGEIYNEDGSLKQERKYDEKGRAKKDIDYNHGGVGHKFPHVHDWEWKEEKSKRHPPREPKEGELETTKRITTGVAVGTILYYVISEGSRIIFPVRNLIPIL